MRHAAWHNPQVSLAGTRGGAGAEMSEFGARFRSLARVLGCCVFSMTLADRCPSFAPPLRGEKWGYVGDIGGDVVWGWFEDNWGCVWGCCVVFV